MLTVLGGLAEFERELIRAGTGEGRARAIAPPAGGQSGQNVHDWIQAGNPLEHTFGHESRLGDLSAFRGREGFPRIKTTQGAFGQRDMS